MIIPSRDYELRYLGVYSVSSRLFKKISWHASTCFYGAAYSVLANLVELNRRMPLCS